MNLQKIVFPTDFSTSSDAALQFATTLAKESGATLYFVHVEEPPLAYGGGEMYYGLPEPNTAALLKMLHELRPTDPSVKFEHRLLAGEPAHAVVDFAESENADLIVLGTHGRTGLGRLVMGSVAEQIVRRANCPVLTMKQPALQKA